MNLRGVAAVLALLPALAEGEPPVFEMTFEAGIESALRNSESLAAAERELEALRQRTLSQAGFFLPRVSLEGSYRYVTEVPYFTPVPGGRAVTLGDNENYSYGPTVNWVVWDWGGIYQAWRSAGAREKAKREEAELIRRQVRLSAVFAYSRVELGVEQVRLFSDALKLAQAQYKDIATRLKAGAASRIDALQAHQEVLSRSRGLASARADLGSSLQDLMAMTGAGKGFDASFPWHREKPEGLEASVTPASVIVSLDPLDNVLKDLESLPFREPDAGHPSVKLLSFQAEAASHSANSLLAARLPRVQFSARTSIDYPNGPILEEFNQRTAGVVATMPLFEGGKVSRDEWEQREQAKALAKRRDQAMTDLMRDWAKASTRLEALRVQEELDRLSVSETAELARLIYESYRSGQVRFIEVETANLRALEARVEEARTKMGILGQLAVLQSLSKEE